MNNCPCLFCSARRLLIKTLKLGRAGKVSAQVQDIQPRTTDEGPYSGAEP